MTISICKKRVSLYKVNRIVHMKDIRIITHKIMGVKETIYINGLFVYIINGDHGIRLTFLNEETLKFFLAIRDHIKE